jgi:hypothetical protein
MTTVSVLIFSRFEIGERWPIWLRLTIDDEKARPGRYAHPKPNIHFLSGMWLLLSLAGPRPVYRVFFVSEFNDLPRA